MSSIEKTCSNCSYWAGQKYKHPEKLQKKEICLRMLELLSLYKGRLNVWKYSSDWYM